MIIQSFLIKSCGIWPKKKASLLERGSGFWKSYYRSFIIIVIFALLFVVRVHENYRNNLWNDPIILMMHVSFFFWCHFSWCAWHSFNLDYYLNFFKSIHIKPDTNLSMLLIYHLSNLVAHGRVLLYMVVIGHIWRTFLSLTF